MGINIGNNNKIKKTIIGNKNSQKKEASNFIKITIELLIAVISGLIVGYFIYKFGWNK